MHSHHVHIRFAGGWFIVQVWEDLNQHIKFVDVTEECRRLYGRVQSNCSLLEVSVVVVVVVVVVVCTNFLARSIWPTG